MERITHATIYEQDPRKVFELPLQVQNPIMASRPWPKLSDVIERRLAREPELEPALTPWSFMQRIIGASGGLEFERAVWRALARFPKLPGELRLTFERALAAWRVLMVRPGSRQVIARCREAFDTLHRIESDLRESAALTPRIWQRLLKRELPLETRVLYAPAPDYGFAGLVQEGQWQDVRARGKWEPDRLRLLGHHLLTIEASELDLFTDKMDGLILPMWFAPEDSGPGGARLVLRDVTLRLPAGPSVEEALWAFADPDRHGLLDPAVTQGDWLMDFLEQARLRLAVGLVEEVTKLTVEQQGRWRLVLPDGETWIVEAPRDAAESQIEQGYVSMVFMPYRERM